MAGAVGTNELAKVWVVAPETVIGPLPSGRPGERPCWVDMRLSPSPEPELSPSRNTAIQKVRR